MSTLITAAAGSPSTTAPVLVLGYDTTRDGRSTIHDLIGGDLLVVLVAPRLRSGQLELLYTSEASALASLSLHSRETTFSLADTDRPGVNMTYVVDRRVRMQLDPATRARWVVTVGYQEVEV